MPTGSGIYEDEPREHEHVYEPELTDDPTEPKDDPAPDDYASKDPGESAG